jgi:hypothetical protein
MMYPPAAGVRLLENFSAKPFDSLRVLYRDRVRGNTGKLTDTIWLYDDDLLYVNSFVDSQLEWSEKGCGLKQETRFLFFGAGSEPSLTFLQSRVRRR